MAGPETLPQPGNDSTREWFAKSVQWMEKGNKEESPELKRFRAEAAELLGVEHKD